MKVVDLMMLVTWCCKFFRVEYNSIQFSSIRIGAYGRYVTQFSTDSTDICTFCSVLFCYVLSQRKRQDRIDEIKLD